MITKGLPRRVVAALVFSVLVGTVGGKAWAQTGSAQPNSVVYKVQAASGRLEMTVNSSRILTMDHNIPQVQVNNPEVLVPTILSPTQIQISAKKPGVTQVNLWDEKKNVYTVDVLVFRDAQELAMLLQTQFPTSAVRVIPVSDGVLISGYVDQQDHVSRIIQIAQEYYPKVLNNITVGGVQQVLLHVKVMEVSRTKLRELGFDWAQMSGSNVIRSSAAGLLTKATPATGTDAISIATSGSETMFLAVLDGANAFFGVLDALRHDSLMKVLSEPTLITVSGRPAQFQVGGSFPILVPQSLGTVAIEYKDYGTQVDFVPIVLGNGYIRLEVRPCVSEVDNSRSISLNGYTVPGLRQRRVDTGVEMQAGQTLAIAGLVQTRVESYRKGIPWVAEVPYIGALFRKVKEEANEVETLVLVTPELVDAMNPCEVPPHAPGTQTTSPNDWELYMKGHIEVPNCRPSGGAHECGHPPIAAPMASGLQGQMPCTGAMPGMMGPTPATTPMPGLIDAPPEPVRTPEPMGAQPAGPQAAPKIPPVQQRAPAAKGADATSPSSRNNSSNRQKQPSGATPAGKGGAMPSFLGPIGYDAGQ